jgi:hypothetical protein
MANRNLVIYGVWLLLVSLGLFFLNFPGFFGLPGFDVVLATGISDGINFLILNLQLGVVPILGNLLGHVIRVPRGVETVYAFLVVVLLMKDFLDEIKIEFRLRPRNHPFLFSFVEHLPVVVLISIATTESNTRFLALVDAIWDGFQDLRTRFM